MPIRARHYQSGSVIEVTCQAGTIASVGAVSEPAADLPWIAPGLCDVQVNGCLGISFGNPAIADEQMRTVMAECVRHGMTEICPTVITASADDLLHSFRALHRACERDRALSRHFIGFHLEGPYLSGLDGPRGAHPREHVRDPDWDEFQRLQDAAGGRIRMVTLAPERSGALAMIERLAATGVVVAIGHTAATPAEIRAAVAAGAKTSTHLGNGSHAMLPRHDNYLWEQLAADGLWASLIVDGHHLPASVVKSMIRGKTLGRLLLTCDAGPLAGMPPGRYRQWETELEIEPEGKIVVAGTPYLAGSWAFGDTCVRTVIEYAGLTIAEALELASAQPRRLLGLAPHTLDVGQPADFILFDHGPGQPFAIRETVTAAG